MLKYIHNVYMLTYRLIGRQEYHVTFFNPVYISAIMEVLLPPLHMMNTVYIHDESSVYLS